MYFTSQSILSARAMVVPGSKMPLSPVFQFSNSDVFPMYQNLVEGRAVPWSHLVNDMLEDHHGANWRGPPVAEISASTSSATFFSVVCKTLTLAMAILCVSAGVLCSLPG